MANPRHLANELLTRCKLKQPTLEDIVFLVGENGYEIIIDEYKKNAPLIVDALKRIKQVYLPE